MAKFEGIKEYHDGLAVSEYMNMLPMGTTCLDRVGETLVKSLGLQFKYKFRGSFVDSLGNIYVAVGTALFRIPMLSDGSLGEVERMQYMVDDALHDFNFTGNQTDKVTFCESTVKPTVVYCCDGTYIYMWNTSSGSGERAPYMVNGQYLPEMGVLYDIEVQPNVMKYITTKENSAVFDPSDDYAPAKSICWFDNKLVMQKRDSTIVWISCTDPAQFFRDPTTNPHSPPSGYPLWNSWYSSTASSDSLNDIASYKGQLFFLNTHSIEIWGRTGNEDSPIQSNTTQVIHFGGRSPLIVNDTLYAVCNDSMGDEFIGAFTPQFQRISNPEVERRLGNVVGLHNIVQRHENYLYVRESDSSGFLFKDGFWSSWSSPADEENPVVESVYGNYAVTVKGDLVKFDEDKRTTSSGFRIERYIRDGFEQFDRRVIFRRFEVVMDTGRLDRDFPTVSDAMQDRAIYVALSTNRGLSFSTRRYRRLGVPGLNNKVIEWRNLGSGNSFLIEVGTSTLHKLQLYDMGLETQ